jgi:hypothetical protein
MSVALYRLAGCRKTAFFNNLLAAIATPVPEMRLALAKGQLLSYALTNNQQEQAGKGIP